ncbi:hypothetical protein [Lonepinella sp. BR2919]|uniref:hypothetical protein n=1 Tax=unclassified Lonepinella TaxID=2642006 RepID=UPI003F6DDE0E
MNQSSLSVNRLFKVYLKRYQMEPIVHLAGINKDKEILNILDQDFTKEIAKIYFFVRSNSFLSKMSIKNYRVSGEVHNLKNGKRDFRFHLSDFFSDILFKLYDIHRNEIPASLKREAYDIFNYIIENKLVANFEIKNQTLSIFDKTNCFSYKIGGEHNYNEPYIHLYQLINANLIDVDRDFLESNVLYIGKSDNTKGILKGRILGHEKMLPILGDIGVKNDEVLVFMFELCVDTLLDIPADIYIPCVEEILIRYFRPNKNDQYVESRIGKTTHINDLMNMGFEDYFVELNFDDHICRFGNEHISYSRKHFISGKLSDLG